MSSPVVAFHGAVESLNKTLDFRERGKRGVGGLEVLRI